MRISLAPLFAVIVLDLIGFGMLMPMLPFYAKQFGATPTEQGWLLAAYAIMQFACAPVWGRLSDRLGRKPVLLLTILGGAGSALMLAWAPSLAWLFVGRLLAGSCAANIGVASAYITDVTDDAQRTGAMGLIGAAFGIGFAVGPLLGGVLGGINFYLPLYVIAALNGLNALQVWARLPEPARHVSNQPIDRRAVLRQPTLRRYVGYNFLCTFGITQLEATFVLYCMESLAYTPRQAAYLLGYTAVVMAVVQGGLIRRLRGDYDSPLLLSGAALFGVAMVMLPMAVALPWLLVWLGVGALGRGLLQPALLGLTSKASAPGERGAVMGVFQSAASLARALSPALAGWLFGHYHKLPFALSGMIVLLVGGAAGLMSISARRHASAE